MEKTANKEVIYNQILQEALSCGYSDVEFFVNEMEDFEVEIDEVFQYREDLGFEKMELNALIFCMYEFAVNREIEDFKETYEEVFDYNKEAEEKMESVLDEKEIFTNYLDSHLYIKNPDDNSTENIDDRDGLKERLFEIFKPNILGQVMEDFGIDHIEDAYADDLLKQHEGDLSAAAEQVMQQAVINAGIDRESDLFKSMKFVGDLEDGYRPEIWLEDGSSLRSDREINKFVSELGNTNDNQNKL